MMLQELKIGSGQLSPGMYVCRLDRPWTDAPFPLQGFLVQPGRQLDWLREHCDWVWIDVERGSLPPERPQVPGRRPAADSGDRLIGSVVHVDTVPFRDELPAAHEAHDNAARLAARILAEVQAGHTLGPAAVGAAAGPIVHSVLRNADALFWVNALQRHDSYAYGHAINCCVLAAAFGRHLGLPAELLVELASGGLLLDIGKARLPQALLAHPGPLDDAAMAQVRGHVELGQAILAGSEEPHAATVLRMLRSHHERWDGSGYPDGLAARAIPLAGRMAAIIDSFDAMTSPRAHAPARARHEALQELYRNRDRLYHGELVEQFTGCLGVYPTGSLVELSTGEVAVVMTQNPSRRLRPLVMLLTDASKALREVFSPLDLMQQADDVPVAAQVNIVRPLPVGAHGLDPAELFL